MYKILYLPTGEDITISVDFKNDIIDSKCDPCVERYGLKSPKCPMEHHSIKYKVATFKDEVTLRMWLAELVERGSNEKHNLRFEHFEIIEL